MAVTQWQTLLRQCLLKRISPDELVKVLQCKGKVNSKAIFNGLLDCRESFCPPGDPLPPRYLEALLLAHLISLSDALVAFITRWNSSIPKRTASTDITSLQEVTMLIMSPRFVCDASEVARCLALTAKWLTAVVHSINHDPTQVDPSVSHLSEACGSFLATLSGTNAGISILSQKATRSDEKPPILEIVGQAVELAIVLFPAISTQLMDQLGVVQKHITMVNQSQGQPDGAQQGDIEALQFQASIPHSQMSASRAGTSLYLEAMLFSGKTIDDTTLFNFLEGRHSNNYNDMFLDVLFSSIQLLQKSFDRGRPFFDQVQIFVRNKLPAVLSSIASATFATFTSEQVISDVWPALSLQLSNPDLTKCGQHFLHVCSLTQLVTEEKRDQLLGSANVATSFSKSLQSKVDVVAEVNNGHTRPTKLVEQLVQTDGSAATMAQAMVEIILTYCQNKETHHLKDFASALACKPEAINALALFIRPALWLSPLCSLLDEWRWDEIHGESQPLYDEFGGILLLILVSKHRLALTKSDIGITNQTGFVSRYLDQEGTEQALQDLSEDSQKHLGEWINALYVAEGLNDELTTSCSPQEFYLFVPTLLRQSLLALQLGKLGQDTFKSGLEFLLEPFLLPSLVSVFCWINNAFDSIVRTLILPIFSKSPDNSEAKSVHQTIMNMANSSTKFIFDTNATPDLDTFQRDSTSLIVNARSNATLSANLQALTRSCGVEAALRSAINVLLHFSGTADFLTALDVTSTMICLADCKLWDLLRLKCSTLGTLLKKDQTLTAEAIVHLHRRVEAYASVLLVQDMGMDQFGTLQLSNIDAVAANMEIPVTAAQDLQHTDQPMDDIDQVLNESAAMGGIEPPDASGLNIDDFYGLQNDMVNLDEIDLAMFS